MNCYANVSCWRNTKFKLNASKASVCINAQKLFLRNLKKNQVRPPVVAMHKSFQWLCCCCFTCIHHFCDKFVCAIGPHIHTKLMKRLHFSNAIKPNSFGYFVFSWLLILKPIPSVELIVQCQLGEHICWERELYVLRVHFQYASVPNTTKRS